ncbi:hypothetical protein [Leptospira yasudae]|uniref:hypothetical protein n=1 Tax=Leptospira yasudae TaxID=2202201 RepID=UPI0011C3884D|nr:hypothetical protein [Leptospira yasudae]
MIQSYTIDGKDCYRKLSFFLIGFAIAIFFVFFQKMSSASALPSDFIQSGNSKGSFIKLLENLTSTDRWGVVIAEKIRFQFKTTYGLYIVIFAYSLFFGKKEIRYGAILLAMLSLLYDLFFVVTNADLSWHLQTAYERIHFHFFTAFLVCFALSEKQQHNNGFVSN